MTKTRFKVNKFDLFKTVNNSVIWLSDAPEFIELEGEIVEEELPKRIDLGVWSTCVSCHSQLCSCPERQPDKTWKKRSIVTPTKKIEKIVISSTKKTHGLIDVFENQIELAQKINEIIDYLNHE